MKYLLIPSLLLCIFALPLDAASHKLITLSNQVQDASGHEAGIDFQYIDKSVRPQDDFFQHVNGVWLEKTDIPADRSTWGTFEKLYEETQLELRKIVESAASDTSKVKDSDSQKIGDLYESFMNEAALEKLGIKPIEKELAMVESLKSKSEIPALIAHFQRIGVDAPYSIAVHQDAKDSTKYIVDIMQSGLGMPDRDYYLKTQDQKLNEIRKKYKEHVEAMLSMANDRLAAEHARQILVLETELAKAQWTKVENRDPVKTYNPMKFTELEEHAPEYGWKSYLSSADIADRTSYVVVSQPSYLNAFAKLVQSKPLDVWKAYFKWRVIEAFAPYLSKNFVDASFAFNGTVLTGQPENRPRWKRGVSLVEGAMGEALGKIYVSLYFPAERKARMEKLVGNLLEAYRRSIETLDWMGAGTKKAAQVKLSKFTYKIGYPNKWRDYSSLKIDKNDLVGNVMRADEFEYMRQIKKLGKPIDREEWEMTPQTVDAYYNPEMNEIVFPAAILQPPFFNADAEDAVNYGGIGAVIGHEISHGFDDQGCRYDGDGNLRDWWTKEDHEAFEARTKQLVAQYASYSPLPGYYVNGELTLGENIADNSGLAIAYKAYKIFLAGKEAPVIGGFTGDQRFFMGWAQVWRNKVRDEQIINRLKTDPHSPARFRTNGAVVNQPAFYEAFDVKAGDKMYLPPDKRVTIW